MIIVNGYKPRMMDEVDGVESKEALVKTGDLTVETQRLLILIYEFIE